MIDSVRWRRFSGVFPETSKAAVSDAALLCIFAAAVPSFASAQDGADDPANYAWQAGAMGAAQKMRAYPDTDGGAQPTPPVMPKLEINFDPAGLIATFQPGGLTVTSQNAFFADLGANGRTAGKTFTVTDLGRAPYFHNGSAATLLDAVNFYDQRFNISLCRTESPRLGGLPANFVADWVGGSALCTLPLHFECAASPGWSVTPSSDKSYTLAWANCPTMSATHIASSATISRHRSMWTRSVGKVLGLPLCAASFGSPTGAQRIRQSVNSAEPGGLSPVTLPR